MNNLYSRAGGRPSSPLLNRPPASHYPSTLNPRLDVGFSPTASLLTFAIGVYILCALLAQFDHPIYAQLLSFVDMARTRLRSSKRVKTRGGSRQELSGSTSLAEPAVGDLKNRLVKKPKSTPPGMVNGSNGCYQNSIMQALSSLPSLKSYLQTLAAEYGAFTTHTTTGALSELIEALNDSSNKGHTLILRNVLEPLDSDYQQDAQEYLSMILDSLEKEVKEAADRKRLATADLASSAKAVTGSPDSQEQPEEEAEKSCERMKFLELPPVANPLDGLIAQRVGCIKCGHSDGLSMLPFNCLTVPLPEGKACDIQDCLNEYTNLDKIDGVECNKCTLLKTKDTITQILETADLTQSIKEEAEERLGHVNQAIEENDFSENKMKECGVSKNRCSTTKSRQAVIGRPPKSLLLHISRSVYNVQKGRIVKNAAKVQFEKELDLTSWCLGNTNGPIEEWPQDPNKSMLSAIDDQSTASPVKYTLRAAITHSGQAGNGHFQCCRMVPAAVSGGSHDDPEGWWVISDEVVRSASESMVLDHGNVFMLFYERIDAPDRTIKENKLSHAEPVELALVDASLPAGDVESVSLPASPGAKGTGRKRSFDDMEASRAAPSPGSSSVVSDGDQTDLWSNVASDDKTEASEPELDGHSEDK
jgi:ubiquitin carboxyl-terminal hydrolase 1